MGGKKRCTQKEHAHTDTQRKRKSKRKTRQLCVSKNEEDEQADGFCQVVSDNQDEMQHDMTYERTHIYILAHTYTQTDRRNIPCCRTQAAPGG